MAKSLKSFQMLEPQKHRESGLLIGQSDTVK